MPLFRPALLLLSALLVSPSPQEFDKDAFRSRKKWYVSFTFRLAGKSEAAKTRNKDRFKTTWQILREVSGEFVLTEVKSDAKGRIIKWDVSTGVSDVLWRIDDKVSHESVTLGEAGAETIVKGFSKLAGTGPTKLGRDKELKCDLQDMTFEFDLNGLRVLGKPLPGDPGNLILTGEYHSNTPATKVTKDETYPIAKIPMATGLLPKLTETLRRQLFTRKLELIKDGLTIAVEEPQVPLPFFPAHPGTTWGGRERFNDMTTDGGAPLTLSLDIRLSPTPPSKAVLILKPLGYDAWRPLCSASETVKGNDLQIEWRVDDEGGDPARPPKVERVAFALLNTSRLPGVCMNWPLQPASPPDADLRFPAGTDVSPDGQKKVLTGAPAAAGRGTVQVDCFDAGATAELVAEATLDDGRILKATVEKTGDAALQIPDVFDGVSGIARCWTRANGRRAREDDEDKPQGDGQKGDGLTVWEEYRGFWIGGKWQDCDPGIKDLFIYNQVGDAAYPGILLFETATGLHVHQQLAEGEFRADRVINFNTGSRPHEVDQHCLLVVSGGFDEKDSSLGKISGSMAVSVEGKRNGPPKNTRYVSLKPSMLDKSIPERQERNGESYLVARADNTVAHELGHAVGIRHHGDHKDLGYRTWKLEQVPTGGFVIWADGEQVFVRSEKSGFIIPPAELFKDPDGERLVWIGEQKGMMSGDDRCFMRYTHARAYRSLTDPKTLYYHGETEVVGRTLCSSTAGAGVNEKGRKPQPRYGNADEEARRGDCLHRFVISDRWEPKQ